MSAEAPVTVSVTRRFSVSAEQVFDAWLDPELLGRWMFGARLREEEILHIQVDARVGGTFSFLVRRQGMEIDHVGTYRELARPHRLAFTWGIAGESVEESTVTLDIAALEAGSELTLIHVIPPRWAEYASRTEAGWSRMLDVLGELFS